jgi:hypothetical protein
LSAILTEIWYSLLSFGIDRMPAKKILTE